MAAAVAFTLMRYCCCCRVYVRYISLPKMLFTLAADAAIAADAIRLITIDADCFDFFYALEAPPLPRYAMCRV